MLFTLLHKQLVVESRASKSNNCVVEIVDDEVNKNNKAIKTRFDEFIISPFSKNAINNTICDNLFNMYKLTYFPVCIIIKIGKN